MAEERRERSKVGKGSMTVAEAGRKGGLRTSETHGREFYEEIGHKGGQKVRELIEAGKEKEGLQGTTRKGSSSSRGEHR